VTSVPRPRRRAAGLLGGAAVLFFLGSNVQAGWLFVLAAFLFGTAIAGWILPALMVSRIEIDRSAPAEAFQGRATDVELVVRDASHGLRLGVVVEDAHLAPTASYVSSLKPGDHVNVRTERVPVRRGLQGPTRVTVSSSGPFGVAVARRELYPTGETLVLPRVTPLGALPFVHASDTHERSIHPYPRMGQGPEFMGVREHRPGDGIRHVHWPSTARHGTLIVREFEEETTRRLALIIDTSNDLGVEWTPLDRCCSAAASIAMAALATGHGARLVAARDGLPDVLRRADAHAILDWLARVPPAGGLPFHELLETLGEELRGVQTAVLTFPTWRTNRADVVPAAAARLFGAVRAVVAVVVEIDPGSAPRGSGMAPTETADLIAGLEASGVVVYRWTPGQPDVSLALTLRVGAP
jgi:uncharacterized protein (DUF58 family)